MPVAKIFSRASHLGRRVKKMAGKSLENAFTFWSAVLFGGKEDEGDEGKVEGRVAVSIYSEISFPN